MSLSFWIILAVVLVICTLIFTKTVSNDAENDYKLRDILANASSDEDEEEPEKEGVILPGQEIEKPKFFDEPKPEFEHADKQPVLAKGNETEKNIYQELAEKQKDNYSYSTNTYTTTAHETVDPAEEKPPVEETTETKQYNEEPVYYEKINDDACDPSEYSQSGDDTEEYDDEKIYAEKQDYDDIEDFEDDKNYKKINKVKTIRTTGKLFDYVKTFWKGITFSFGALVCLYAFYGIASSQAHSVEEALLYSIWLLIGVILIK